jgi:hypothetical protein
MPICSSRARASSSGRSAVSRTERRTAWTASGPLRAIRSAICLAVSSAWPSGNQAPDQADLQRLLGADAIAGQQDLHGTGVGHLALQADRGAADREQGPLDLGQPEGGRFRGNADVRGLQDLRAARQGVALHGGDQRLAEPAGSQHPAERQVRASDLVGEPIITGRPVGRHGGQVGARTEVAAGAGQDGNPDAVIGVDGVPHLRQTVDHVAGPGVALVGRFMVTVTTWPSWSTRRWSVGEVIMGDPCSVEVWRHGTGRGTGDPGAEAPGDAVRCAAGSSQSPARHRRTWRSGRVRRRCAPVRAGRW